MLTGSALAWPRPSLSLSSNPSKSSCYLNESNSTAIIVLPLLLPDNVYLLRLLPGLATQLVAMESMPASRKCLCLLLGLYTPLLLVKPMLASP